MQRAFKGVWIPKEIWLDRQLGWSEKLLLVEIDSLDNEKGCWASNEYFAEFFDLSKDRISRLISSLQKKGYVSVEIVYKKGTMKIEKRIVRITDTYRRKHQYPIGENNDTPIGENAIDNNTELLNNPSNNTSNKEPPLFQALFDHFVSLRLVKHKKLTAKMKTKMRAALKEHDVEDIKQAMTNYDKVLNSDNHWYTHRYTLQDFMREQSFSKFLDEADPLNNFLRDRKVGDKRDQKHGRRHEQAERKDRITGPGRYVPGAK